MPFLCIARDTTPRLTYYRDLAPARQSDRDLRFQLPEELTAMLARLELMAYLYQPTSANALTNLKIIAMAAASSEGWFHQLIQPYIKQAYEQERLATLVQWRMLLHELPSLKAQLPPLDRLITELTNKLSIVEGLDAELFSESKRLFKTVSRLRHRPILTEMRMTKEIAEDVAQSLGVVYDMHRMLTSSADRIAVQRLELHRALLLTLQAQGFPKVGLLDLKQPGLMEHGRGPEVTAWTGGALEKFFSGDVKRPLMLQLHKLLTAAHPEVKFPVTALALPTGPKKLAKWVREHLLLQSICQQYQVSANKAVAIANDRQPAYELDAWQRQFLQFAQAGKSFIAITPTSAGKTYIGMSSIYWLIGTDHAKVPWLTKLQNQVVIAYVAPSYDLALQTYNNVRKTFTNRVVSLVTARTSDVNPQTQIWIGTPVELWVYFSTLGMKYDVGYFDEVHTLSTNFGVGREATLRSEALANLMTLCQHQLIGLSATIHDADIPRLCTYISERSGLQLNPVDNVIIHRQRPVTQVHLQWQGTQWEPSATVPKATADPEVYPVTPVSTFTFLRQLLEHEYGPALIFDANPETCWQNYSAYVHWLQRMEAQDYSGWHQVHANMEDAITQYNYEVEVHIDAVDTAAHTTRDPSKRTKVSAYGAGKGEKLIEKRRHLIDRIRHQILKAIERDLNGSYTGHRRPLLATELQHLTTLDLTFEVRNEVKVALQVDDLIPVEIRELLQELVTLNTDRKLEEVGGLDYYCAGIGRYYRMGVEIAAIDEIKAMWNPSLHPKGIKLRNAMLQLCEAERIREAEVKHLFDLIILGLEFGVGIIVPTLPFVVHYSMLKLMSKKSIPMIFASLDMSMGINYPIRTVCIRSNVPIEMNVCEYLQAAGRSGRRRLDTVGYVVHWNILNAQEATQANLPLMVLPTVTSSSGSQIMQPLELAIHIEEGRIYALGSNTTDSTLTSAIARLGYASNKVEGEITAINDAELVSAITGCVGPLAEAMGMSTDDLISITVRIKNITLGIRTEDLAEAAFLWASKIGLLKYALQELHTKLHCCSNLKWLQYIESIYELTHRAQLRQMRI
jgi:hypothetical protein